VNFSVNFSTPAAGEFTENDLAAAFDEGISQNEIIADVSSDKWRFEIYPKQTKSGMVFYWHFRSRHSEIDPATGKRKYAHLKGGKSENIPDKDRLQRYLDANHPNVA